MTTDGVKFDASKYLTKLNGKDYLEVKWRLLWLRTEHPDALITTQLVEHVAGEYAVCSALVVLPDDTGSASGLGSETKADFRDYLEKAETKAVGRALAMLGYGTQFTAEEFHAQPGANGEPRVVDSPVQRPTSAHVNQPFAPGVDPYAREHPAPAPPVPAAQRATATGDRLASDKQVIFITGLLEAKGLLAAAVLNRYRVEALTELSMDQAKSCIDWLKSLPQGGGLPHPGAAG